MLVREDGCNCSYSSALVEGKDKEKGLDGSGHLLQFGKVLGPERA